MTDFGLSFELRDGGFFLDFESSDVEAEVNGVKVSEARQLHSGDYIKVDDVEMIVVEGTLASTRSPAPSGSDRSKVFVPEKVRVNLDLTATRGALPNSSILNASHDSDDTPIASVFSPARTTMIDPTRSGRARFGEAMAQDMYAQEDEYSRTKRSFGHQFPEPSNGWLDFDNLNEAEKRVLIGIVFFAVASFLLLIVWLLLVR